MYGPRLQLLWGMPWEYPTPEVIDARVAALKTALDDETINPNEAERDGQTVLFDVARAESLSFKILDTLINHPTVDVGHRDAKGQTVLHVAAARGHDGVVERLLQWHDARSKLVDVGDGTGRTPLSWAAGNGHTEVISLIVKRYPHSADSRDVDGRTPLSFAAGAPGPPPPKFLDPGNRPMPSPFAAGAPLPPNLLGSESRSTPEVIRLLNKARPNLINARDHSGHTPLWWAVNHENTAAVESLLCLQPTPNVLEGGDASNVPSLQLALQSQNKSICSSLLNTVPPPRAHKIVRLLLPETLVNFVHSSPWALGVGSLANRDPLKERDDDGRTALHEAVSVNSTEILSVLLGLKADINATDIRGWTPLHEAAALGAVGHVETLLEPNRKVGINARDSFGKTPLRLALENGHTPVINTLLDHSATFDGITSSNWRDLHHGLQSSNNVIELSEAPEVVSGGIKRIRRTQKLVTERALSDGLPNEGEKKLFFALDGNVPWTKILGRVVGNERDRRSLDSMSRATADRCFHHSVQEQVFMTRVIVSARLPLEDSPLDVKLHNWRLCEAVWEVGTQRERDSNAPGIRFFSMLSHGEIPVSGLDFIRLIFEEYKADWLRACDAVENHLVSRRESQLKQGERDPGFIDFLAKDASSLALLKRILREYVDGGRELVGDGRSHSKRTATRQDIQKALEAIDRFSNEVSEKLATLDQTIRDILQLEFAWVSVNEAHRSTSLAESMKRLSWITFIFLPAIFASSFFGMNVNLLEDNPDWRWYLAFAGGFLILTLVGWIGSKHYPAEGVGGHLKGRVAKVRDSFRAKISARPDMTNGDRSPRRSIGSV